MSHFGFRQPPSRGGGWQPRRQWLEATQSQGRPMLLNTTAYSACKAMIGSVRTARQAGNILAPKATNAKIKGTAMKVPRSRGKYCNFEYGNGNRPEMNS